MPSELRRVFISSGLVALVFVFIGASLATGPFAGIATVRFEEGIEFPLIAQSVYLLMVGAVGLASVGTLWWRPRVFLKLVSVYATLIVLTLLGMLIVAGDMGIAPFLLALVIAILTAIELVLGFRSLRSEKARRYLT